MIDSNEPDISICKTCATKLNEDSKIAK